MSLILDTHSFLWFIMGSPRLSGHARAVIEDDTHAKRLSTASLWEMAIKLSLGRLTLAEPFGVLIPQQLRVSGIEILNIEIAHLAVLTTLPFHHRDPFDRLIIAQAIVEQCPVVSVDPAFDAYSVQRLWGAIHIRRTRRCTGRWTAPVTASVRLRNETRQEETTI